MTAALVLLASCGQDSPGPVLEPSTRAATPLEATLVPRITAEAAPRSVAVTPAVQVPPTTKPRATAVPAAAARAVALAPSPTVEPTLTPSPPDSRVPASLRVPPAGVPAPDRDLFELALRFRLAGDTLGPRVAAMSSSTAAVGERREFFVSNLIDATVRSVTAALKVVSEHAYWYVDDKITVPIDKLELAARTFEDRVHPVVVGTFGDIWSPGVDGDPRLIVLHTSLSGAAGYYSSKDEFTRQVHPHSNLSEIIYIDTRQLPPGTDVYMGVLAHELQHAVHWNQDLGEEAWVNEGLSEVAVELAGYSTHFLNGFLQRPETQLNWWPDQLRSTAPHYGASLLFFSYLAQRYGGVDGLGQVVIEQLDGTEGIDAYLSRHGTSFEALFMDWVIANYLDADEGPYSYPDREVGVARLYTLSERTTANTTLPQFSAGYYRLADVEGDVSLRFAGSTDARLIATACASGRLCWWSGSSDGIDASMTRAFDLTDVETATLEFMAWHDIELGWDFAYVEASPDGGLTWDILDAPHTTLDNPSGNSYGPAYSGHSSGWVRESIDLSRYAGGRVLVRFEYITDDAVHLDGLVLDDIAVPEIGFFDDAEKARGWDARGFSRMDGTARQRFAVQLIERDADGKVRVVSLELDELNIGEIVVRGLGTVVEQAIVVVSPITRQTRHPATFSLSLTTP